MDSEKMMSIEQEADRLARANMKHPSLYDVAYQYYLKDLLHKESLKQIWREKWEDFYEKR